jgi:hypothetical protein
MNTADPARPRGRILVVEDDAEAAFYAVHVLTTMGPPARLVAVALIAGAARPSA